MSKSKSKLLVVTVKSIEGTPQSHKIELLYVDTTSIVGFPVGSNAADPLVFPRYAWEIENT